MKSTFAPESKVKEINGKGRKRKKREGRERNNEFHGNLEGSKLVWVTSPRKPFLLGHHILVFQGKYCMVSK